jgi:hypothetical protein
LAQWAPFLQPSIKARAGFPLGLARCPLVSSAWFHLASNFVDHECAIDQQATDDQDKQNQKHFAPGLDSHDRAKFA